MDRYHTFWPRVWAGFIDAFVFLPLWLADDYFSAADHAAVVIIGWNVIIYSSDWLYTVLFHARFGQTIGKAVMKVSVLDVSEERLPSLRQAFVRDSVYILVNMLFLAYLIHLVLIGEYVIDAEIESGPGAIVMWAGLGWFLLEIITMATNKKRRALHDCLAGTVVVRID